MNLDDVESGSLRVEQYNSNNTGTFPDTLPTSTVFATVVWKHLPCHGLGVIFESSVEDLGS